MRKRLIARVGLVKVYRDTRWGEYCAVGPDNVSAHDDDKESMLDTARAMARHYGIGFTL